MTKLNAESPPAIGDDVGGTNIKAALVHTGAEVVELHHEPTAAVCGADFVVANVLATIE